MSYISNWKETDVRQWLTIQAETDYEYVSKVQPEFNACDISKFFFINNNKWLVMSPKKEDRDIEAIIIYEQTLNQGGIKENFIHQIYSFKKGSGAKLLDWWKKHHSNEFTWLTAMWTDDGSIPKLVEYYLNQGFKPHVSKRNISIFTLNEHLVSAEYINDIVKMYD